MSNEPAANTDILQQNPANNVQASNAKPPRKKLRWYVWLAIAAGAAVLLLGLAVGGFFLYVGNQYAHAESSVEKQDYKAAVSFLQRVPKSYRDSSSLTTYAQACLLLEGNRYDEAKTLFQPLGSYRDSASLVQEADYRKASEELNEGQYADAKALFKSLGAFKDSETQALECDYRQAAALLENNDYDHALPAFQALAELKYKDSGTMVKEVKYRIALSYYDQKDYVTALSSFSELGDYKDSADKRKASCDILFQQGVSQYRSGDYDGARKNFLLVMNEAVNKYLILISIHEALSKDNSFSINGDAETYYKALVSVGDLEDANELKMSNVFILYYLKGAWLNKDGSTFMTLVYNKAKDNWYMSGEPYITSWYISEGKFYYNLQPLFRVTYLSDNSCRLDFLVSAPGQPKTITLTRA